MTNIVLIKVDSSYNKLISFLIDNNIYYSDLKIKGKNIYLKIYFDDLKHFKYRFKCSVIKRYNIYRLLDIIKNHYIIIICFIISYLIILILSKTIFTIEINTSNTILKNRILNSLSENGIEKYKFVKSKDEIESIKKNILNDNKELLEWIEIDNEGTKIIVNLTERIVPKEKEEETPSNIVAKKDGLIEYIVANNGTKVREVNELVKKGDLLITGNIIKDEEIIDSVRAKGRVYAQVWYTVNTSIPYKHIVYEKTGTSINHIYLKMFNKKFTLIGKYETNNSMNSEEVILKKPYLFFEVVKESKELFNYREVELSYEEALEEAIKRSDKAILDKLNVDEYIIDKKVLKITKYSSKIDIEVFYKVYENITQEVEIEEGE